MPWPKSGFPLGHVLALLTFEDVPCSLEPAAGFGLGFSPAQERTAATLSWVLPQCPQEIEAISSTLPVVWPRAPEYRLAAEPIDGAAIAWPGSIIDRSLKAAMETVEWL